MKNNKGFTVVELSVSFCLVAVIAILLFQVVLSLKEVYTSGDIKTGLLTKQGLMLKKIKEDLNSKTLVSVTSCEGEGYCFSFTYTDGSKKLEIINNAKEFSDVKNHEWHFDAVEFVSSRKHPLYIRDKRRILSILQRLRLWR